MGGFDGNAIPVSKYFTGKHEKFILDSKANGKDEPVKQISGDEPERCEYYPNNEAKEEDLGRKQKKKLGKGVQDMICNSELCWSNSSATSSERKRRSADLFDDSVQKRQKQQMNPSAIYNNLSMGESLANGFDLQKQESSGSSGKRRRASYDIDAGGGEADGSNGSVSKKRKVGNACNDLQLKMLGPLKLPDYVKGFKFDYESDPEIIKLKKQLLGINRKLRAAGAIDDCIKDDLSPSPPPIYNEIGIRVNTRENRLHAKLGLRKQQIIGELIQKNPLFWPPSDDKPTKFSTKLYIPVKQYPNYNFIGLIIGPRGHTQKRMERESGARILLRGKGSLRVVKYKQCKDLKADPFEEEDLHVYIEADDEKSLENASQMVEKLLVPLNEKENEHKHAQLRELRELNSEFSSEALKATFQNNAACYIQDDAKPASSPSPLSPAILGNTQKIENVSGPPSQASFQQCMIKSASGGLTSHDTKLNSASGSLTSHDAKPAEVIDKAKLFVGFLPQSVNTESLIELFLPFGRLYEAVVIMDRSTGLSKGYGFVKFIDPQSAAEALVQMNGFRIDGKVLSVRIAGWSSLKYNTIIGPRRASRFSNMSNYPALEAIQPTTFSQGVTKGSFCRKFWSHTAKTALPEPHACFPKCTGFPSRSDSIYRRARSLAEFSGQSPVARLCYGGPASSMEFVQFPCHQTIANSCEHVSRGIS